MTLDLTKPLRVIETHEPVTVLKAPFKCGRSRVVALIHFKSIYDHAMLLRTDGTTLAVNSDEPIYCNVENVPDDPPADTRYLGVLKDSDGFYVNGIYGSPERCFAMSDAEFCMPAPIVESQLIRRPQ